jgi:hypothetical protein
MNEEPTEEQTHPVALSEDRKTVARGLMVLLAALFLVVSAAAIYWVFNWRPGKI